MRLTFCIFALYKKYFMERLLQKSDRKATAVKGKDKRYLYHKIDWQQQLILLLGHRGTGKTTLLLQHLSESKEKGVYLSLDDIYFESNRLIHLVEELYQQGIRKIYLDEVHRYLNWSKDLKQIYDDYDDLQIIATGSSILDVSKGSADLSRRASIYRLQGLSFREYLMIGKNIELKPLPFQEIIERHHEISGDYLDHFTLEKDFNNYVKYGYYPFFLEGKKEYFQKLQATTNLVIDTDIAPFEELNYATVRTMKKMLYVISQSAPFTPNISKLSEKLNAPRNTLLRLMDLLSQAKIINLLRAETKGVSYLQKPEKIYLENTNLMTLFSNEKPNIGNNRETFLLNQLTERHDVTSSKYGDFMIDDTYTIEVGGPSKTAKQIQGVPNAFLALAIEGGTGKRVPLWLFGFLY